MGLDIGIHGLEKTWSSGYIYFGNFRRALAKAYNQEFGELYSKWYSVGLTEEELKRMNELCNDDLDIFLQHSDCEGKIISRKCGLIYEAIKDIELDWVATDREDNIGYNVLERWKYLFKYCYENKKTMRFW